MSELDIILEKFSNGYERYNKSALFNTCVNMISRGVSHYQVMEELFNIIDKYEAELYGKLIREPMKIIVTTEQFEKLKKDGGVL